MKHSTKKIYLIDDNESFLNKLKQRLSKVKEYSVATAKNGDAGLKMVKKSRPDLIVLDIIMPKMDGFEMLKKLRADRKISDIPVLMITQVSDPEKIAIATRMGVRGYLVKADVNMENIVEQVAKVFEE